MHVSFLALCWLACLVFVASVPFDELYTKESNQITDEKGRSRIFHGLNVVFKRKPYIPDFRGEFNATTSFNDEDMANLQKWGFNVVRLFVSWDGVMLSPTKVNTTYLDDLVTVMHMLDTHNISVLLDAHQDVIYRGFCGEAMPSYVFDQITINASFPAPFNWSFQFDQDNMPLISDCTSRGFADYYFTKAAGETFQALYLNKYGVRDAYVDFWTAVATHVRSSKVTNLIGYELINEPWAGDIYEHPSLLVPGVADRELIQEFNNEVAAAIRKVDETVLIFYESVTFDVAKSGFTEVPGGDQYQNKSVFSYHVYCLLYNANSTRPRADRIACDAEDSDYFEMRRNDIKRLGGAGMLTEFGSIGEAVSDLDELTYVTNWADKNLHGYIYWQYKNFLDYTATGGDEMSFFQSNGTVNTAKVKTLARPYAPVVAGTLTTHQFDAENRIFSLIFTTGGQATESCVFLSEAWWYANASWSASLTPSEASYTVDEEGYLWINTKALDSGTQVSLTINPQ